MKQRLLLTLFFFVGFALLIEGGYYYYLIYKNSNQEKVFAPIELVNHHPEYLMKINPSFKKKDIEAILKEYNKSRITFYLVGSESQVPWAGASQRGREFDGKTNLPMNMMMAIYKDNFVEYYLYPYPENYQRFGEKKLSVLSRAVSYKIIEALAANDRGYLVEAKPVPIIPMEEIKKYCMDNPLVLVEEKNENNKSKYFYYWAFVFYRMVKF